MFIYPRWSVSIYWTPGSQMFSDPCATRWSRFITNIYQPIVIKPHIMMGWDVDKLKVLQNTYYADQCWPSLRVITVRNQPSLGLLTLEDPRVNNRQENVLGDPQTQKISNGIQKVNHPHSIPFALPSLLEHVQYVMYSMYIFFFPGSFKGSPQKVRYP